MFKKEEKRRNENNKEKRSVNWVKGEREREKMGEVERKENSFT